MKLISRLLVSSAIFLASLIPGFPSSAWAQPKGRSIDWSKDAKWKEEVRGRVRELEMELKKNDQGKKDYRDEYILLHKLYFKYQVMRETDSDEAKRILRRKERILKIHPELHELQDFRLSEEIDKGRKEEERREKARDAARDWLPTDETPLNVITTEGRAILVYQQRIAFCPKPKTFELKRDPTDRRMKFFKGPRVMALEDLQGCKVMSFRGRMNHFPTYRESWEGVENLLVCAAPLAEYVAVTPKEREMMDAKGYQGKMKWTNPRAEYADFCGIVSLKGQIVYRFPFTQRIPDNLLRPLTMSSDGRHAAVMVGEKTPGPEGEGFVIWNPREVLEWDFPDKLKRTPIANANITFFELRGRFEK